MLKGLTINRGLENMEFIMSRWSIESHAFIVAWGEFCLTLEDVVILTGLSIFREARTIKLPREFDEITLDAEGKRDRKL